MVVYFVKRFLRIFGNFYQNWFFRLFLSFIAFFVNTRSRSTPFLDRTETSNLDLCLRRGFGSGMGIGNPLLSPEGKVFQIWIYRSVKIYWLLFFRTFSHQREKVPKRRRSRGNLRFPLKILSLAWWRTRCLCTALIAPEVTYAKTAELLPSVATNSVAQRARELGRCSRQGKENCNFPFGESQIKISQPSSKPLPTARLP